MCGRNDLFEILNAGDLLRAAGRLLHAMQQSLAVLGESHRRSKRGKAECATG